MRKSKFVIYKDKAGEYRWSFYAANGRLIADSGEGYKTKKACKRARFRVCRIIRDGDYKIEYR